MLFSLSGAISGAESIYGVKRELPILPMVKEQNQVFMIHLKTEHAQTNGNCITKEKTVKRYGSFIKI